MRLQSEILRVIRGKLTASALSRKLGYKFNQFSRWESGEKRLLWTDFVAICKVRRLPLREQIILFLGYEGDLLDTAALTKTLLGGKSIDEASKATKLDRSRISRWLRGKAPPTFLDIYTLLGSTVNVLSFLEPIVNLQEVPILAADYAVLRQQRELAFALPYLDALMEAMIVRRYMELNKHDSKALGAIAGIPAEAVDRALTALEAVGMVEKKIGKILRDRDWNRLPRRPEPHDEGSPALAKRNHACPWPIGRQAPGWIAGRIQRLQFEP
ncbi:MAG: hypothetical protein ACXVCK_21310 [Bdellovibrionota bacterium]